MMMVSIWKWFDAAGALLALCMVVFSYLEGRPLRAIEVAVVCTVVAQAGVRSALAAIILTPRR